MKTDGFDTVFQVRITHTDDVDSRMLRGQLEEGLVEFIEDKRGVVSWAVSHVGTTNESVEVPDVIARHKEA